MRVTVVGPVKTRLYYHFKENINFKLNFQVPFYKSLFVLIVKDKTGTGLIYVGFRGRHFNRNISSYPFV